MLHVKYLTHRLNESTSPLVLTSAVFLMDVLLVQNCLQTPHNFCNYQTHVLRISLSNLTFMIVVIHLVSAEISGYGAAAHAFACHVDINMAANTGSSGWVLHGSVHKQEK